MEFLALPLGLLVGLSLGVLGTGGSILIVPMLVYVLDLEPKSAITVITCPLTGRFILIPCFPTKRMVKSSSNSSSSLIVTPARLIVA